MTLTLLDILLIFGLSNEVYFILLFIAAITFFFWRWLLKKYINDDQKRKIFTWLATIMVTPIIYSGFIMLLIMGTTYIPSKDFEKSLWLTDREDRFQMANDIIKSKILINKDSNQVKQILGDPTRRSDTTYQKELKNSWFYDMGMGGGGLGFMFHSLIVKFDNKKVVVVEHGKTQD